jgi:hypothetical protein
VSAGVLHSHRSVTVPELGARVSTHALLHPRYRLHAVLNERVVCEDAVLVRSFDRRGHLGRPIATLLLDGAARVSAHGRSAWLGPGDIVAMDEKGAIVMRQEGERYAALAFEWDPAWLGPRPEPFLSARVDEGTRAEIDELFARIVAGDGTAAAVVRVVSVLRAAGVALRAPGEDECTDEVSEKTAALSGALDGLFSRLDEQPMIADLERRMGVTSRQINRLVAAFNERYGWNAGGWRDARNRRRLFVGVALMTAPGATGELVARAVGYRALSAFTHALTEAGLPPPSAIAAAVAAARGG